jgi:adenylate cyclase
MMSFKRIPFIMQIVSTDTPFPQSFYRAQRTVVFVDLVESVRLMEQDEVDVIQRWQAFVGRVVHELLPMSGGRLVSNRGDGLLLEFGAVPLAVQCTLSMHTLMSELNTHRAPHLAMWLRASVHVADVVVDALDLYGKEVNIAARLAAEGQPGETIVSAAVRDQLVDRLDAQIEDIGERYLKGIELPVPAYRVSAVARVAVMHALPNRPRHSLRPTIAVVPFQTHDANDPNGLLGEALADELIASLSRNPAFSMISRLSTSKFRGRANALAEIAQHLKAHYVVSGSLHVAGTHMRIVTTLTEVSTQQVIWTDRTQAASNDIFVSSNSLIDELVLQLCQALGRRQIDRSRSEPMSTLDSYCLLMAAVGLLHGTRWAEFEQAGKLLEHLSERDRHHPAPHAWLAKWHVLCVQQGWSANQERNTALALDCSRRALGADPSSSLSLAIDGFVHCNLMKDMDGAMDRLESAQSCNPSEPLAWLFKGIVHAFKAEGEEAIESTERALELSPLDPMRYFFESLTATAYLSAGHFEKTVNHARQSLKLHRTHTSTLRALTIALVQLGQLEEARATAQKLLALEPHLTIKSYLKRSPSAAYATGQLWSQSLAQAGVPQH